MIKPARDCEPFTVARFSFGANMTLEIPVEIETDLRTEANARGVSVETLAFERLSSKTNGTAPQARRAALNRLAGRYPSARTVDDFMSDRSSEEGHS